MIMIRVFQINILSIQTNNLYGKSMLEPLPTGQFQWLNEYEIKQFDISSVTPNGGTGYTLEVDLEYPSQLHCKHSDYPLSPERKVVS